MTLGALSNGPHPLYYYCLGRHTLVKFQDNECIRGCQPWIVNAEYQIILQDATFS